MKLGDRICLLNEGRVEQIDTPDGFRTRPKSDFVKQFMVVIWIQRIIL